MLSCRGLFTGLEIPPDVAQVAVACCAADCPARAGSTPENYHVTLRFIGDVDDAIAREVASVLGRVQARRRSNCGSTAVTSFGGKQAARGGRDRRAVAAADRAAGRAGAADAAHRPRAGRPQIHAACHAGAAARRVEPRGRRISLGARAVSRAAVSGVALRAVLVARLGRRRALCGRGGLSAAA